MSNQEERINDSLIYLCKYQIGSIILVKEDEKIDLDYTNVMLIEYLNDYEFNHMAMLKVTLRVDLRKRLWILKHKKKITCHFELNKIGIDIDLENFITSPEECWNLEFGIYLNDEDDAQDVSILEQRLSVNEEEFKLNELEEENYFETQNIIDIYLFNPKLLKASKTSFNRVWTKDTLQNFTAEMLTATKHENVLMSKFDNDEIYQELLMPHHPAYKCLIYLDQNYGLYKKGAMIYYDIDALYILNLNGEVTVRRDKHGGHEPEWTETSFIIPNIDGAVPGNGIQRVEGEPVFYPIISEMDINPQKFTITNNVEIGSEAKMVLIDDFAINVETSIQSFVDKRNELITFIKKRNKYTGTVIKARMEENECILYISVQNVDINAFTPNKTFRVIFNDPIKQERFGKNEYRLAYAYHAIKATSTHYMDSSHRIILKKTKGPVTIDSDNDS